MKELISTCIVWCILINTTLSQDPNEDPDDGPFKVTTNGGDGEDSFLEIRVENRIEHKVLVCVRKHGFIDTDGSADGINTTRVEQHKYEQFHNIDLEFADPFTGDKIPTSFDWSGFRKAKSIRIDENTITGDVHSDFSYIEERFYSCQLTANGALRLNLTQPLRHRPKISYRIGIDFLGPYSACCGHAGRSLG